MLYSGYMAGNDDAVFCTAADLAHYYLFATLLYYAAVDVGDCYCPKSQVVACWKRQPRIRGRTYRCQGNRFSRKWHFSVNYYRLVCARDCLWVVDASTIYY